jgi:hypothetical protein
MVRTIACSRAVHLTFQWDHNSLRRLPLQTDGKLKDQQRCNCPVCGSVTHKLQPYTADHDERRGSSLQPLERASINPINLYRSRLSRFSP